MCLKRAELAPDAYLTSPQGLFRVRAVRPNPATGRSEVVLTDESVPLQTERVPHPDDPGRPAPYRVVEPDVITLPLQRVLDEFDVLTAW